MPPRTRRSSSPPATGGDLPGHNGEQSPGSGQDTTVGQDTAVEPDDQVDELAAEETTPAPPPRDGVAHHRGRTAARRVHAKESVTLPVPLLGRVELPSREQLVFLGGIGLLAVVGTLDWPVAVILGLGHTLASQHHNKALEEFGEALDEG